MSVEAPYEKIDQIGQELILKFREDKTPPMHAYMACILVAGRLVAPPEIEFTDERGVDLVKELSTWIEAYWYQGKIN